VSRAVRVPTRLERDLAVDLSNPAANPVTRLLGNKDFDSEKLTAYELGYRGQIAKTLSVDIAAFDNHYSGLASLELGTVFVDPSGKTVRPIINRNLTAGTSQGVETLLIFSPRAFWRLSASHSYLQLKLDPRGQDLNRGRFSAGATPRHQFGLRSFLDLPHSFQADAQFRHLSAIAHLPTITSGAGISGYSELDARLAWRGWKQMEISLVGQNLLHKHHAEFGPPASRGEIQRSVYGKIAWGF
jgi:iron complex outermembrane receptor protein